MITINSQLDMTPGAIPVVIHRSQYDSDFSIIFTLFARTGNFTIASGTTAKVRGTKKSGTGYSADATIDVSAKTVTVTGDQQMTVVSGQNIFEIVLMSGTKELCSANFILDVERAALDMDTITDDTVVRELDNLDQFITEAEAAADRAEDAAATFSVDETLTVSGKAADAKTVGDAIASEDKKALAAFATDTTSGSIASFSDGADNIPMKDVLVHVNPVQDLHGYDNPWPAGGGVNQWDEDWESGYYNRTTGEKAGDSSTTYFRSKNYIPCAPNTSYYFKSPSVHASNDTYYAVLFYDADKNYLSAINSGIGNTARTTPQNAQFMTFYIEVGTSDATYHNDIAINYPATVTTYFPYSNICPITGWTECTISHSGADMTNPTTYSITFPSEADTVYGGTLDVTNGVLTVDRAIIASYAGETLPTTWISDRDVYSEGATPTTGAQVCYKLATPITYQLTPQEITSLLGTNNLWVDTGDIDVEYRADTKVYVDAKVATAESNITTLQNNKVDMTEPLLNLNESATSGSDDDLLLQAINDLGWYNDVIV